MLLRYVSALLLFLIAQSLSFHASAQESLNPAPIYLKTFTKEKPSGLQPELAPSRLSLSRFVNSVDSNFPKLLAADAERRLAAAKLLEKSGAFDPVLTHLSEYLRLQDTITPGKAKNPIHNEARLDLLTRSGMRVFAGARLNPNDTKTPFLPTGRSGEYYAGLNVPLLRGRLVNEKMIAEQQAKLSQPLAQQVYLASRIDILLKAAGLYWEWLGSKARLEIANNLLTLAIQRVDQIKARVDSGDAPAFEIAEAEQEVERRRAALTKAERDLQKSSIQMSVFLWRQDGKPDMVPQPSEMPPLGPAPKAFSETLRENGRNLALSERPELKRIAAERKIVQADLRLARNLLLPVVDAYVFEGVDTGTNGIGPVVRTGLNLSVPLRRRTARGLELSASTKLQKLDFDEAAERQRIVAEVDDSVSAIKTSYDRYVANTAEVGKARLVESGEKLRFSAGDSTLFLVNQRERATAEAQMRLIDAHVDYLQALTAFNIITCQL